MLVNIHKNILMDRLKNIFISPVGHHKSQDKLPHSDGGGDGALDRLGGHPLHHFAPWQGETLTNVDEIHIINSDKDLLFTTLNKNQTYAN